MQCTACEPARFAWLTAARRCCFHKRNILKSYHATCLLVTWGNFDDASKPKK